MSEPARRPPALLVLGIAVGAIAALAIAARAVLGPREPPLPAYFAIPDFTLTSHEGRPFGTADLRGRAWVAGFFFTRCPSVCPILLQRQKEVQARTAELGDALQLVTISIDPAHDTPEAMRAHAESQGLTLTRWTLLTGETEPIETLVRDGFKEYLKADPGLKPEEIVHSVRFFLVDPQGQVRGLYDGLEESELDRLEHDARSILDG